MSDCRIEKGSIRRQYRGRHLSIYRHTPTVGERLTWPGGSHADALSRVADEAGDDWRVVADTTMHAWRVELHRLFVKQTDNARQMAQRVSEIIANQNRTHAQIRANGGEVPQGEPGAWLREDSEVDFSRVWQDVS